MVKKIISLAVVALVSLPSYALRCNEEVIEVILSGDQHINFKTSAVCNWCEINPSWSEEQKNRAYSMLLTAIASGKKIGFEWGSQVSQCTGPRVNDIKPSTLILLK